MVRARQVRRLIASAARRQPDGRPGPASERERKRGASAARRAELLSLLRVHRDEPDRCQSQKQNANTDEELPKHHQGSHDVPPFDRPVGRCSARGATQRRRGYSPL